MIISMTGFGKASKNLKKMTINVELRSINSKYLEISSRMPLVFNDKETELKEVIGQKISRGKISTSISIDRNNTDNISLQIKPDVIKDYFKLLQGIKKSYRNKRRYQNRTHFKIF